MSNSMNSNNISNNRNVSSNSSAELMDNDLFMQQIMAKIDKLRPLMEVRDQVHRRYRNTQKILLAIAAGIILTLVVCSILTAYRVPVYEWVVTALNNLIPALRALTVSAQAVLLKGICLAMLATIAWYGICCSRLYNIIG